MFPVPIGAEGRTFTLAFQQFQQLAISLPLTESEELATLPSTYGNNYMYLACCYKQDSLG